jgi:hypothetical protein
LPASDDNAAVAAGRDSVEDAEQGVRIALVVARDQLGILKSSPVYILTRLSSRRRMAISRSLSSSEILTPSTFGRRGR